MPLYGLEVTAILHDAAHTLRRRVREATEMGAPPDGIDDMVRSHLLYTTSRILRLPPPCGERYKLFDMARAVRVCERERGHAGPHDGNL